MAIWEWLFAETAKRGFADALCALIVQIVVDVRDQCLDQEELLPLLNDLSGIEVKAMLARAARI
jgi:hypothetical protein